MTNLRGQNFAAENMGKGGENIFFILNNFHTFHLGLTLIISIPFSGWFFREKKAKKLRQIGSENTKILAKIEVAS